MLDPTVSWVRCKACAQPEASLPQVQECLADLLLRKVLEEIEIQQRNGDWHYGSWEGHLACYYLNEIAMVAEDVGQGDCWLLISSAGVMRQQNLASCLYHLKRKGVPAPSIR